MTGGSSSRETLANGLLWALSRRSRWEVQRADAPGSNRGPRNANSLTMERVSRQLFTLDNTLEGPKNCELEKVRFEFDDRTSPGKFTLGENFVYIVMPITVEA